MFRSKPLSANGRPPTAVQKQFSWTATQSTLMRSSLVRRAS